MCGFAGYIDTERLTTGEREAIAKAGGLIVHRGPDDHAVLDADQIRIEFRRLSIMDVAHGRQPFRDASGRFTCFMNGEIYNFRDLRRRLESEGVAFETDCDTEVVPHLLAKEGEAGLRCLNGMFAIVVYDALERRLLLLRDPFGIKPLYVAKAKTGLAFASEIKCFLPLDWIDKRIDLEVADDYRSHLFSPSARTPFEGIENLAAGRLMEWSNGGLRALWSIDALEMSAGELPDPSREALQDALCAAIDRQVVSDVPVGLSLSGGIDSGLLAAGLKEVGRTDIRAYHIEGVTDLAQADSALAKQVADHLGITMESRSITPSAYWSTLPKMVWMLDEPIGDPAALSAFEVARLAGEEVRVLLMGTGGDELFHGYGHMRDSRRGKVCRAISRTFPPLLKSSSIRRAIGIDGMSDKTVRALTMFENDPIPLATISRTIWPDAAGAGLEETQRCAVRENGEMDRYSTSRRLEVEGYLQKQLLPLADRSAMASSVEGRVPILDLRFWTDARGEAGRSVRAERNRSKPALRALAERWLPDAVVNARKSGFANIVQRGLESDPEMARRVVSSSPVLEALGLRAQLRTWTADERSIATSWLPVHAAIVLAVWEVVFSMRPDHGGEPPRMDGILEILESSR